MLFASICCWVKVPFNKIGVTPIYKVPWVGNAVTV